MLLVLPKLLNFLIDSLMGGGFLQLVDIFFTINLQFTEFSMIF